jgi:hypothetical protein
MIQLVKIIFLLSNNVGNEMMCLSNEKRQYLKVLSKDLLKKPTFHIFYALEKKLIQEKYIHSQKKCSIFRSNSGPVPKKVSIMSLF